jgi:hypothetical protein
VRAVFIFARFVDAEDVDANGDAVPECENCGPAWDLLDEAPSWPLLEDTDSPTIPGSLTHLFHEMSNGQHILRGEVIDTVFVSGSTLAYWHDTYGRDEGIRYANRDLLESQVDPYWNFSGVDFIFVMWRSVRSYDESDATYRALRGGEAYLFDLQQPPL